METSEGVGLACSTSQTSMASPLKAMSSYPDASRASLPSSEYRERVDISPVLDVIVRELFGDGHNFVRPMNMGMPQAAGRQEVSFR